MKTKLISTYLLLCCLCLTQHRVFGQDQVVNRNLEGSIAEILGLLHEETGVDFSYSSNLIDLDRPAVTTPGTLKEILTGLFPEDEFLLGYRNNKIIVTLSDAKALVPAININGYIRDAKTGESLIGAAIVFSQDSDSDKVIGTVTNSYGFFSIKLKPSYYRLECSYIGYRAQSSVFFLERDTTITFSLRMSEQNLEEILVTSDSNKRNKSVISTSMGKAHIPANELKSLPALFGEVDLIKSIQQLPGVATQGEGSSNFYVRGGAADQNLILLDEAPVYNPSHLLGFFSIFNQDALHSLDFYRGVFPVKYGGRLSSVMDIRMKEGNANEWTLSGGIGLTAARISVEGPLKKNQSSILLSARRTYADLFLRLSADDFTRQSSIFFYDLNGKINYKIDNKNHIYLSGYFGRDLNAIRSLQYSLAWGNSTGTLRWNHIFGKNIFSNLSLIASNYQYLIDLPQSNSPFDWRARIRDYAVKYDFSHYWAPELQFQYGLQSTLHHLRPGESELRLDQGVSRSNSLEHGIYASADHHPSDRLALSYGIRLSIFQLLGGDPIYEYGRNGEIISKSEYPDNKIYQSYMGLEPRVTARYTLDESWSIKFAYARNYQYLNMLSNLSLGFNVFDIWIPSSINVKPQHSDQISIGSFHQTPNGQYSLSVEGYYKWLDQQIDFRDHSSIILNPHLEAELLTGDGKAYGIELMLRKEKGDLKGWLGYTWSRSFLNIPGINQDRSYPTLHDQPHQLNLSASYRVSARWTIGTNFVCTSGRPVTLPVETFWYNDRIAPIYSSKNSHRLPVYHRLDLSVNLFRNKTDPLNDSHWTFSIYNVYNRHNAATAFVTAELQDLDLVKDSDQSAYHQLYILGIIPSVTYNFKF